MASSSSAVGGPDGINQTQLHSNGEALLAAAETSSDRDDSETSAVNVDCEF